MNIGKVSQASGVTAKMIRYYEQIGLIPAAGRSNAGYRSYSDNDVERLKFISFSKTLLGQNNTHSQRQEATLHQ